MKNFVRNGNSIPVTATAALASGQGVLTGALFGVASTAAAIGETVELAVVGVFDLPKTSAQAWVQGAKVYWDAANSLVTTTVGSNVLIGTAFAPAANPSAMGRVRLNGYAA
ncbi:DUF2190 family protein [Xanthobacter versatilis]|uniref:DUF2190 family protein n=1 Tax=Xanthobacter autotrophicus (strain ATCC BAA-1158 / Py2) TaxID=78245 RepID=UPI00372A32B2